MFNVFSLGFCVGATAGFGRVLLTSEAMPSGLPQLWISPPPLGLRWSLPGL